MTVTSLLFLPFSILCDVKFWFFDDYFIQLLLLPGKVSLFYITALFSVYFSIFSFLTIYYTFSFILQCDDSRI